MIRIRILAAVAMVVLTCSLSAADDLKLRFAGRDLNPGDQYNATATVEFVLIDMSRGVPRASDGGRVLDDSMIQYRQRSQQKAAWSLKVPASGDGASDAFVLPFDHPVAPVAGRLARYFVTVRFSRAGTGPKGEPVSFSAEQAFPVELEAAGNGELCVIFQGMPGGSMTLGVRSACSDSVLPASATTSRPPKR